MASPCAASPVWWPLPSDCSLGLVVFDSDSPMAQGMGQARVAKCIHSTRKVHGTRGVKPMDYTPEMLTAEPGANLSFSSFFTTNPLLIERSIGLRPDRFADRVSEIGSDERH